MPSWLSTILAALCAIAGLAGTLTLLVFMIAGSANLSPPAAQTLTRVMWATSFAGLLCLAGEVALLCGGKPLVGSIIGVMPLVVTVALFVWTVVVSG